MKFRPKQPAPPRDRIVPTMTLGVAIIIVIALLIGYLDVRRSFDMRGCRAFGNGAILGCLEQPR